MTLIEHLESRTLFTAGELVVNSAMEGTVGAEWVRGSAWQAGALGHSNYHGGAGYAYNGTSAGSYVHNTSGVAGEMYQQVTIPAGMTNATLQFWTKITTEETTTTTAFDTMAVQVLNSSGGLLQTLTTLSNLNAGSTSGPYTSSGKYNLHTFSLGGYAGQTIRLNFKVVTDSAKGTMFRVDDVSLAPPVPVVPGTSGQVVGYLPDYRYSLFGQMDLNLLTHINYFSIGFASNGTLNTPSATFNSHVDTVVAAAHAKGVGVSITTGPGQPYAAMAANATSRAKLVSDLKAYVLAHNLDGVDIDWEPPAKGADQVNYGLLIDELYAQLNPIGKKITAAVNPWTKEIPVNASKLMNWINVMCYDFDYDEHSTYAAATDGMLQWQYFGVAKDKLVMGVPFYGRWGTSWSDTHSKTYGAMVTEYKTLFGVDIPPGVDSYTDAAGKTTYFNGVQTMQKKMAFVRDNAFAGAFTWELGQDSWDAALKHTKFSLLPVMHSMIRPPSWLTTTPGSTHTLVNKQFFAAGGTVSFSGNISASIFGIEINIDSDATAAMTQMQRFGSLNIAPGGKLDVKNNALIIDYSGANPTGSWNGSAYTGVAGMIQSGRNGGSWNGSGIVTSMSAAIAPNSLTTVGFADSASLLGLSGSQTAMWNGRSVDATCVLIKYTYGGDANLDGQIDGDDYFAIDSHVPQSGSVFGYINGDFNFDGEIDGDDYFLIDSNYVGQGSPL